MSKIILVTGGNAGIGFALCTQLVVDKGCKVYLGARNAERGQKAVADIIAKAPGCESKIEFVEIDVASDASVKASAETVKGKLGDTKLYAIVNNAGTGLAHGVTNDVIVNTNLYGPKRVCEAFMPLLNPTEGRIANVGSGAGPMYMAKASPENKAILKSFSVTWEQIEDVVKKEMVPGAEGFTAYGVSKAGLTGYTMILAKQFPQWKINCLSPGFINTAIVTGYGASKPPEEGTVALHHCLFNDLKGNGYYYGSDGVRSPLTYMRNPGEPEYDGSDDS